MALSLSPGWIRCPTPSLRGESDFFLQTRHLSSFCGAADGGAQGECCDGALGCQWWIWASWRPTGEKMTQRLLKAIWLRSDWFRQTVTLASNYFLLPTLLLRFSMGSSQWEGVFTAWFMVCWKDKYLSEKILCHEGENVNSGPSIQRRPSVLLQSSKSILFEHPAHSD